MKPNNTNWEWKKLGEICENITKGTTPTTNGFKFEKEGINFIKIESITDTGEFIEEKFAHVTPECNESLKRSKLNEGDILFSIAGALGRVALVNAKILPANTNQALAIIRLKEKAYLQRKYLFYVLKSELIQNSLATLKVGVAQYNISLQQISNMKIPVPPLPLQQKIVSILEQAENLKQKREQANEEANKIIQSVFYKMFGDIASKNKGGVKLFELCKFIDYRGKTPTKVERGVKLITAKNVRKGFVQEEPKEHITEVEYEKWMTRGFPKEGDLLFTTEAPLGNVARLGKFTKIALAQRIIDLQPVSKLVNTYYLMYYLLSEEGQRKIISFTTGSTVSGVRAKELKSLEIPLPPISLQNQFASIVEKIESIKQKQNKATSEINTLFDALMQKAFKGEMV